MRGGREGNGRRSVERTRVGGDWEQKGREVSGGKWWQGAESGSVAGGLDGKDRRGDGRIRVGEG